MYWLYEPNREIQALFTLLLETAVHIINLRVRSDSKILIFKNRLLPEIRELQRLIETYEMRYFPQHVLLCTSTVHDQSANICIQGYLRILWIRNKKSSKIDWIHKFYVSCFKFEHFFKSFKLNPWMDIICNKWPRDGTLKVKKPIVKT